MKNVCLLGYILYSGSQFGCATVLFLSPGGREADFGSIGRGMRCGRSGKFHCVAEPQVPMHAFVMPGNRYDVGDVESYRRVCQVFEGK